MPSPSLVGAVMVPFVLGLAFAFQGAPPAPDADPAPAAPPVVAPSRAESDALTAELAVLDRAASSFVTVPSDARTLRELLDSLAAQSGVPVEADWDALATLRISPDDAPPLARGEGSLLAVLDALCVSVGVPYARPRAEAILGRMRLVTPTAVISLRHTRAYQADQLASEFAVQAAEHVDPEGWVRNGGESQNATQLDGTLLVSAPASIHRRLAALLEELRLTRAIAFELATVFVRVPSVAWREHALDAASPAPLPRSAVTGMAGATVLSSPTLVTAIDMDAIVETSVGDLSLRVSFRPERDAERGALVHFEMRIEQSGAVALNQGTVPAPVNGLPAVIAIDVPGTDETIVMFMRARPLPRSALPTDP